MRITQSNKALGMVFRFPEQVQEQGVPGVPELEFGKTSHIFSFNLDRPLRYFSVKIFISWQSKLANFQQCIFWKNIFEKLFQNKNSFTIFRSEQQF